MSNKFKFILWFSCVWALSGLAMLSYAAGNTGGTIITVLAGGGLAGLALTKVGTDWGTSGTGT